MIPGIAWTLLATLVSLPVFLPLCLGADNINQPNSFSLNLVQQLKGKSQNYRLIPPDGSKDSKTRDVLLDIVLLATIDGKFHALNRTNGRIIWSMAHDALPSASEPISDDGNALSPLVRTVHGGPSADNNSSGQDEDFFIVEPQSGDIYVLPRSATPSTPLAKLQFSVPNMVEMSPFMFAGDESRVFVGKKETKLIVVELETGRVRGVVDHQEECVWEDRPTVLNKNYEEEEEDADERLVGKRGITEIYIGRTDYRIQVYSKPKGSSRRSKTQTLVYSAYGPNSLHGNIQKAYTHSKDGLYIQGLPGGGVMAFNLPGLGDEGRPDPKWSIPLPSTVIATFDVLSPSTVEEDQTEPSPYILLQPRPHISQIFKTKTGSKQTERELRVGDDVGYVDMIGDSLYVLGSEAYPLAIFSPKPPKPRRPLKLIDGPSDDPDRVSSGWIDIEDDASSGANNECDSLACFTGLRSRDDNSKFAQGRLGIEGPSSRTVDELDEHEGLEVDINSSRSESITGIPPPRPTARAETGASLTGEGWWKILLALICAVVASTVGIVWTKSDQSVRKEVKENGVFLNGNGHAPLGRKVRFQDEEPDASQNPLVGHMPHRKLPGPVFIPNDTANDEAFSPNPIPGVPELVVIPATPGTAGSDSSVTLPSAPSDNSVVTSASSSSTLVEQLEDEEAENDAEDVGAGVGEKKKKNRMRSKTKKKRAASAKEKEIKDKAKEMELANQAIHRVEMEIEAEKRIEPVQPVSSLVVSEEVLGFGSHGTMVFKGSFQGRAVAVKRLLNDFVTLASREVTLLQESDDHPNVIRYYYQEARNNFLYIALELCPASLADIIERPDSPAFTDISCNFEPRRALQQITSGLRWLHGLKIVHRDIKPQNILVAYSKGGSSNVKGSQFRMLISDFGLCKKLGVDETSFLPTVHGAMAAGTVGWRAPEILRGEVKLDDSSLSLNPSDDNNSQSSRGSVGNGTSPNSKNRTRLTKSVDVFALGCLFYYTLTSGGHPFGDRFEREVNIMKNLKDMRGLEPFGEEGVEAMDLIAKMVDAESPKRPDTTVILLHPFFWTPARRLTFLTDASDRFEVMTKEPREPPLEMLETSAQKVVGNDWYSRLDRTFIENLGKFRKYDVRSVQDLLRALRNKKHHYQDLPDNVKRHLGPLPEGFLLYFTTRYPALFLHVYHVISTSGLSRESMFQSYFELVDV